MGTLSPQRVSVPSQIARADVGPAQAASPQPSRRALRPRRTELEPEAGTQAPWVLSLAGLGLCRGQLPPSEDRGQTGTWKGLGGPPRLGWAEPS